MTKNRPPRLAAACLVWAALCATTPAHALAPAAVGQPARPATPAAAPRIDAPLTLTPAPATRSPASVAERAAFASAVAAAQADIPRAAALPLRDIAGEAALVAAGRHSGPQASRGAELPEDVLAGTAVNGDGEPLRSARVVTLLRYITRAGDTLRSVAYRAITSPQALAVHNRLRWTPDDDALEPGLALEVPLQARAGTAFGAAARLVSGPGVRVDRPHHAWGRPFAVRLLADVFASAGRAWPQRHPFIVHDLSRFGGGRIGGHKSHRAGIDIDVGYPTREAARADWGVPGLDDIDYERLWFLVDRLEHSGYLAAIYMSPAIQRRLHAFAIAAGADADRLQLLFQYPSSGGNGGKSTLIRQATGHRDHMHIRFASPEDLPEFTS